jgi:hypothetical protein
LAFFGAQQDVGRELNGAETSDFFDVLLVRDTTCCEEIRLMVNWE